MRLLSSYCLSALKPHLYALFCDSGAGTQQTTVKFCQLFPVKFRHWAGGGGTPEGDWEAGRGTEDLVLPVSLS